ncbi:MAG TPA: hypothetical protein VLJ16_02025 [Acidobacteriota bacterium]|nr:hypothetical protein [Acidobacteriota bacterium]
MDMQVEKQVRFLRIYAIVATVVFAAALVGIIVLQSRRSRFGEIDVERINIIEQDGRLRMVISNEKRQHPGIVNGKVIPRQGSRPPGLIFFNQLGDEMGGLIFGENGGIGHFGSLTFDKVRNDQAMGFRYLESDNGTYQSGMEMWQQPNIPADIMMAKYEAANKIADETKRKAALQELVDKGELTTNRLFLGKRRDDTLLLSMADIKGNTRIRLKVAPDGTPTLELLDEAGQVIYALPEANKASRQPK